MERGRRPEWAGHSEVSFKSILWLRRKLVILAGVLPYAQISFLTPIMRVEYGSNSDP